MTEEMFQYGKVGANLLSKLMPWALMAVIGYGAHTISENSDRISRLERDVAVLTEKTVTLQAELHRLFTRVYNEPR